MDEVGIVCTAMNAPFEKLEEHLDQVIADAKALDTKYIVIGASPEWVRTNGKEGFLDFAKRLNVVGEKLAAEGLYLHFHNHALEFRKYDGVTGMDILLENTDPRYVFFQLDTHWVQSGGGHVVSWIYKAKGRMKVVHFKDYLIDRYSDTSFLECTHRLYAEVGEGSLNWLDIIQACRDIGVEWFVTEQDRCVYRPPFEAIKISYDNPVSYTHLDVYKRQIREIDADCPTLTYNTIGRHASCMVRTRIASVKSPWLTYVEAGDIHAIPVSHGEGRFVGPEGLIRQLFENGQVATQYVDLAGNPTMDSAFNPNGAMAAIEGILSPDGRVMGKMGHSERIGANVVRNVPGEKDQKLFKAGVDYFR